MYNNFKQKAKSDLEYFLHSAVSSPLKPTLLRSTKTSQFTTCPGLTVYLIQKHIPKYIYTRKGHLQSQQNNIFQVLYLYPPPLALLFSNNPITLAQRNFMPSSLTRNNLQDHTWTKPKKYQYNRTDERTKSSSYKTKTQTKYYPILYKTNNDNIFIDADKKCNAKATTNKTSSNFRTHFTVS